MLNPFRKKTTFSLRPANCLPKGWHEVYIADMRRLETLRMLYTGLELSQRTIEHFTGITVEQTNNYSQEKFARMVAKIKFLDVPPTTVYQKSIFIQGKEYRCNYNRELLNTWQMITIQGLGQDYLNNLHRIAAVCYTEPGHKPEHNYTERAALFEKHLPISVIIPLAAFFLNSLQGLLKATRTYSGVPKMRNPPKPPTRKTNGSAKNGDGMQPLQA